LAIAHFCARLAATTRILPPASQLLSALPFSVPVRYVCCVYILHFVVSRLNIVFLPVKFLFATFGEITLSAQYFLQFLTHLIFWPVWSLRNRFTIICCVGSRPPRLTVIRSVEVRFPAVALFFGSLQAVPR